MLPAGARSLWMVQVGEYTLVSSHKDIKEHQETFTPTRRRMSKRRQGSPQTGAGASALQIVHRMRRKSPEYLGRFLMPTYSARSSVTIS